MFFGNTFSKLPNRVLLSNCFFTNFHFNAKFEGSVSALAAAKTEFDDAFTTQNAKKNKVTKWLNYGFAKAYSVLSNVEMLSIFFV
jgi:hypothetical protein